MSTGARFAMTTEKKSRTSATHSHHVCGCQASSPYTSSITKLSRTRLSTRPLRRTPSHPCSVIVERPKRRGNTKPPQYQRRVRFNLEPKSKIRQGATTYQDDRHWKSRHANGWRTP